MAYFTRSRAKAEHKAAGVLPFSLHEGTVLVLLGAEPSKTGPGGKVWRTMWRDFGGSREAADADSPATAAREFAEETLGLFGACGVDGPSVALAAAAMEARLREPGQAVRVVHSLKRGGAYHFYVTQTPFLAPLMLRLASQQNAATKAVEGAEKSAFAWVPFRALLECVAVAAPRYFLESRAHVCGSAETPPVLRGGRRRFQLHPCFASSLRMAQSQGLEQLIAQARELPLPPPPPLPLLHQLPPPLVAAAAAAGVLTEPAASAQGGSSRQAGGRAAVDSAAARRTAGAAAADGQAEGGGGGSGSEGELEPSGSCWGQESLSYWLAQSQVAAALQGCGAGAELEAADEEAAGLGPASSSQPQSPRGRLAGFVAPGAAAAAGRGIASRSASLAPASSMDTASSLRQSRQAAVEAAVGEVVQQIEANSHRRQHHRLSRKQRQKLRRQRQRQQQEREQEREQQEQEEQQQHQAAAKQTRRREEGSAASPAAAPSPPSPAAQSPPPHWQRAARDLEAAFQPHVRLHKRLRLVVGPGG